MKWPILSDTARSLLDEMAVVSRDIVFRRHGMLRCLSRLRSLREIAAIPSLLWFLHDPDEKVAQEVACAIQDAFEQVPVELHLLLDEHIRCGYWWPESYSRPLQPEQARAFDFHEQTAAVLGCVSCHSNGYVREQAVLRLDREITDGREIPFLLLRLDDWAGPVRAAAAEAIARRLADHHRSDYLRCLSLVVRLQGKLRAGDSSVFAKVKALLGNDIAELTQHALSSSDASTRRTATTWAWQAASSEEQQRAVLEPMLASDHVASRIRAVSWAAGPQTAAALQKRLLPALLNDRLAAVRRLALGWCATCDPEGQRTTLYEALLDKSSIMRSIAQFYLPKLASLDLRAFYRQAVEQHEARTLPAAIAGLGETGRAEDAGLVVPHFDAPEIAVRKAVIVAVARLAPEEHLEFFLRALNDPGPGVSRQVRYALEPLTYLIGVDQLREIGRRATSEHVRRQTLSLVARLPRWQALPALIEFHGEHVGEIQAIALTFVTDWLSGHNRTYWVQPTAHDLGMIQRALDMAGKELPPLMRSEIARLVSWSRR